MNRDGMSMILELFEGTVWVRSRWWRHSDSDRPDKYYFTCCNTSLL